MVASSNCTHETATESLIRLCLYFYPPTIRFTVRRCPMLSMNRPLAAMPLPGEFVFC
jgi:hypothetical protein